MQQIDTLLNAHWIVPVEPEATVYRDYSLVVHEGRILDLLPQQDAKHQYAGRATLELDHHVLIPGLINTHTHAAMSLFRGLADDLPLMEWLNDHIWPAESRWVSNEFVHDGTLLAITEMLRGGTTCFNDMYFFPEETARAVSATGIRAVIGLIMIDFPTAWAANPEEYLSKGLALQDRFRNDPLIRTAFAPHAPYTVSDGPLQQILTYAEEVDIPIHMHVHETADEISGSREQYQQRPLQRLERLGLLSPRLLAVHMTQLTDEEIELAASSGIQIIHCPESNLKLASGFCPVHKLHQAGLNIALGTDGAASNNDLDMLGEMRTTALLSKAVAQNASVIPAATALRMATINGARALGIDGITGSLRIGKAADVVAIDMSGLESQPLYHPISQLVYATSRHQVSDVWIAGRHLLKERRLASIDEQEVSLRVQQWQEKIAAADSASENATTQE